MDIESTRIVRAKLFCQGYLSPRSTTASYIFHQRKMTLPIISIVSNDKYFYDNKLGIIVDGNSGSKKNYEYDWRRPINQEYFTEAESPSQLNQLCETRVMGGASRGNGLKSLTINADMSDEEKAQLMLSFNGVSLSQASFDGKFFSGREITLTGECTEEGKDVLQWHITSYKDNAQFTQTIAGSTCTLTMPLCSKVEICAVMGESTGIKDLTSSDVSSWTWSIHGGKLSLSDLPTTTPIYIYSMQGSVIYQGKATNSSVTIPLSQGAYILKVGGKAVKIIGM